MIFLLDIYHFSSEGREGLRLDAEVSAREISFTDFPWKPQKLAHSQKHQKDLKVILFFLLLAFLYCYTVLLSFENYHKNRHSQQVNNFHFSVLIENPLKFFESDDVSHVCIFVSSFLEVLFESNQLGQIWRKQSNFLSSIHQWVGEL